MFTIIFSLFSSIRQGCHYRTAIRAASPPSDRPRAVCRQLRRLDRGGTLAKWRAGRGVWIVLRCFADLVRAHAARAAIHFHRLFGRFLRAPIISGMMVMLVIIQISNVALPNWIGVPSSPGFPAVN